MLLESGVEVQTVLTPPEAHRERLSGWVDLGPLAQRHGVTVERVDDVNAAAVVSRIARLAPDLIVVAGWTRLLGESILAIPKHGCVGFHASLLPRHRGRAPVNWAILLGEQMTGNTMLMLSPEADGGDIVDQRQVPIKPEDTCADVYAEVGRRGAEMLHEHLGALLAGAAPRTRQDHRHADVLPRRTPAMGITVWDRPARAVHDWIRALTLPYPGAFTLLGGRKVMLWRTAVPLPGEPEGPPGQVLACDERGMRVGTRAGSVVVTAVSDASEPPHQAASWCRRSGVRPGIRFDPVDPESARWALGPAAEPLVDAR